MLPPPVYFSPHTTQYNTHDTSVVNSGASNIYSAKEILIQNFDATAPKVNFVTATNQVQQSVGMGTLVLTNLPSCFLAT